MIDHLLTHLEWLYCKGSDAVLSCNSGIGECAHEILVTTPTNWLIIVENDLCGAS